MSLLKEINDNGDLRAVKSEDIPALCQELREFLMDKVSRTGGHLASNLGAVELTVALHRVYDPMKDRILFDVGHQAYIHKILTGRREAFDTLRQYDGISGFPLPEESDADPFLAGHASEAVSLALGMARARTLSGADYDVVAVVGDGAMTGGLCYEGLCDAGASREPIVIVLNDNGMSINRNVGGIARLLSRARMRPGYYRFKKAYRRMLQNLPEVYKFFHRIKERIKKWLLYPGMFEDLGFEYIGPIDGHDEAALETAIRWARDLRVPVLVHTVTVKGKGYAYAEEAPERYHGVNPFSPGEGVSCGGGQDFSACFGAELTRLAERDQTICAVTAAMEQGTGLECFAKRYPSRFFELGIVEEHAVSMCAGMAKQGLKPVFAVYSSFLQRSFDMLMQDVGLMGAHVVLAVDRAGLVGSDGVTHQGCFDLSYLGAVPGLTLYAPASFAELRSMLERALCRETGPVAIRYPRGGEGEYADDHSDEPCTVLSQGADITIICHGIMTAPVLRAGELLRKQGLSPEIVKINRIFPLETETALISLRKTGRFLSVEDAARDGSVGSRLLASAAAAGLTLRGARQLDLGNGVIPHGSVQQLHCLLGLDAKGIALNAQEVINGEGQT